MIWPKLPRVPALVFVLMTATGPVIADEQSPPPSPPALPAGPAAHYPPLDDGDDWLQLTSGEWLRGEMISFADDTVEFDSEVLGKLEIDAEDVLGFHSSREFGVSARGEDVVFGQVRVEGRGVSVQTADGRLELAPEDLVAVTAAAQRERDRWSGDVSAGLSLRQGNSDRTEYNMVAGTVRRTARSRFALDYIGSYNETDGVETANDHRLNVLFDRFSGSRLFWRPLIGQYLRDPFQNIEHQGTLETGLGYDLIDTARTGWEVYSGVGVNHVRRVSVEEDQPRSSTSPSWSVGTRFDTELTRSIDFAFDFQMTFLDEESGEYQHHLVTTLSTDLVRNLDFDISFVWDRTRSPPAQSDGTVAEQDDFRLITGIGFDF